MRGAEHAWVPAKIDEFMCTDFFVLLYFGELYVVFLFVFFLRREGGLVLIKEIREWFCAGRTSPILDTE